jgi:hypothetical protein
MEIEEPMTNAEKALRKMIMRQITKDGIDGDDDPDSGDEDESSTYEKLYPKATRSNKNDIPEK